MIKNDINTVLCDMGILVPDDNNDIDLSEYIIDSLQFISFIVEIENKFGIEIPDELLNIC